MKVLTNDTKRALSFVLLTLIPAVTALAFTETFYIAQGGDGSSPKAGNTATAWDADDFSNSSNWAGSDAVDGKIGPNDLVVFLGASGTLTGSGGEVLKLHRSGLSGRPITLRGSTDHRAIVDGQAQRRALNANNIDNLVVEGIDFTRGKGFTMDAWDSNNVVFRDIRVSKSDGVNFYWHGDNVTIQNSEFFDSETSHGVYLESRNALVEHSYFHGNGMQGVHINAGNYLITGVVIRYNLFQNNGWADISNFDGHGNQIYGNVFHRTDSSLYMGIVISGDGTTYSAKDVDIFNNTFYGSFEACIYLHGEKTTGTRIRNNVFVLKNRPGSQFFVAKALGSSTVAAMSNNIYFDGTTDGSAEWMWTTGSTDYAQTLSQWQSLTGMDLDSSQTDPMLRNASSGDFALSSGSPAIDAGISLGLTMDRTGTSVPQGSGPDIGAFEFVGQPMPPQAPSGLRIMTN